MKARTILSACAVASIAAVLALAQEPKERPGAVEIEEVSGTEPSPHHAILESLEGVWETEMEMTMDPTAPPTKSRGLETVRRCGDLWVVGDLEADFLGQPFRGHWIGGYDSKKGKHVGVWVDSFGDSIVTSEGTCEANCATIRSTMRMTDPATGEEATFREVAEMSGRDVRTFRLLALNPDGSETLSMKGTYRRRK